MHPFVHSFNPAIAPPWQTRTDWDAFMASRRRSAARRRRTSGVRKDVVAAPLLHDTPDETGQPARRRAGLEGRRLRARARPDHAEARRRRARLRGDRRQDGRARAAARHASAPPPRASPSTSAARSTTCGTRTARCAAASPTAARRLATRRAGLRGDPRAVRHHQRPPRHRRASATLEKRTGQRLADLAAEHEGKQITFADTQSRAGAGHHLPEWSGRRPAAAATRRSPSTSNGSSRGTR